MGASTSTGRSPWSAISMAASASCTVLLRKPTTRFHGTCGACRVTSGGTYLAASPTIWSAWSTANHVRSSLATSSRVMPPVMRWAVSA